LFGVDRLASYADTIVAEADAVIGAWGDGETVDLYRELATVTVRVIAGELLGLDLDERDVERILATSDAVAREFTVSPTSLVRQLLPTPPSRTYREAIAAMHAWADDLIDARRAAWDGADDAADPADLLEVMLAAERDPETGVDHELVRDELLTFLFAGYETTALTLSFALWFVSRRPSLHATLREEAAAAGDPLGWRDLPRLETAERVVRETLRLRPASWGIFREARTDTRLGDEPVAAGDYLMCPQWTLHRDARFFDAPDRFDPDRWRERDPNATSAYFPFGAGPQSCIGGRLARTEATLVLARVCREVELETPALAVDDLRPAGVLQPRGGVPAHVTRA
jgi:cytochrome P450